LLSPAQRWSIVTFISSVDLGLSVS